MTHEEVLDEINVIYERLSHPEDCENGVYSFRDGNYLEALEILIDYYEVGVIEELEKIKEEIHILKLIANRERNFPYANKELEKGYELALEDVVSVIDKRRCCKCY